MPGLTVGSDRKWIAENNPVVEFSQLTTQVNTKFPGKLIRLIYGSLRKDRNVHGHDRRYRWLTETRQSIRDCQPGTNLQHILSGENLVLAEDIVTESLQFTVPGILRKKIKIILSELCV